MIKFYQDIDPNMRKQKYILASVITDLPSKAAGTITNIMVNITNNYINFNINNNNIILNKNNNYWVVKYKGYGFIT